MTNSNVYISNQKSDFQYLLEFERIVLHGKIQFSTICVGNNQVFKYFSPVGASDIIHSVHHIITQAIYKINKTKNRVNMNVLRETIFEFNVNTSEIITN